MALPQDPNILFSLLNMKLRDFYSSLDALCDDMDESKADILERMKTAGYRYDAEKNAFVR